MSSTVLLLTRNESRREKLAYHVANQLEGQLVAVESLQQCERIRGRYDIDSVIVDLESLSETHTEVVRRLSTNDWYFETPTIYIFDLMRGKLHESSLHGKWISSKLPNGEVVDRLSSMLDGGNVEPSSFAEIVEWQSERFLSYTAKLRIQDALEGVESALFEFQSGEEIPRPASRTNFKVNEPFLSMTGKVRIQDALDSLEIALFEEEDEKVSEVLESIREASVVLGAEGIGFLETEYSSSEEGENDPGHLLKERLDALGISTGVCLYEVRPHLLIVGTNSELDKDLNEALLNVCVERVPDAKSLHEALELTNPEIVLIVDETSSETSRTLQVLQRVSAYRSFLSFVMLTDNSAILSGQPKTFGVDGIFTNNTPLSEVITILEQRIITQRLVRPNVVIIDEDWSITQSIVTELELMAVNITVVENLYDVSSAVRAVNASLVILNSDYRERTGVEVCESIGSFLSNRPPIMMIHPGPDSETQERGFRAGVSFFAASPIQGSDLRRKVSILIERHQLRVESHPEVGLLSALREMIGVAKDADQLLSLITVDIDHLISLCEEHGPSSARRLLSSLETYLKELPGVLVFREWSDRFVLIPERPLMQGTKCLAEIERYFKEFSRRTFAAEDGKMFHAYCSAGHLLISPMADITPEAALAKSRRVLNQAKRSARGKVLTVQLEVAI